MSLIATLAIFGQVSVEMPMAFSLLEQTVFEELDQDGILVEWLQNAEAEASMSQEGYEDRTINRR